MLFHVITTTFVYIMNNFADFQPVALCPCKTIAALFKCTSHSLYESPFPGISRFAPVNSFSQYLGREDISINTMGMMVIALYCPEYKAVALFLCVLMWIFYCRPLNNIIIGVSDFRPSF